MNGLYLYMKLGLPCLLVSALPIGTVNPSNCIIHIHIEKRIMVGCKRIINKIILTSKNRAKIA